MVTIGGDGYVNWLDSSNCRRHEFNPWVRKSPGGGNDNQLQHSCLESSMNRGAWQATVHGIAESDMTQQLSAHT